MGFDSFDDYMLETTQNLKQFPFTFGKTSSNAAASAAGRWHEFFTANGVPGPGSWSGAAGSANTLNGSSNGALFPFANQTPDTKHLSALGLWSSTATLVPGVALLCDFLGYHPACVVTGTPTTISAITLPRYATGAGVQVIAAVQSALGAAAPVITCTYTDQNGNTGNTAGALTAAANSLPISTLLGNTGMQWMPLAAGDTGVRQVASYTIGSGTTGTIVFIYVRPLSLPIPIASVTNPTLINMMTEIQMASKIEDGACLGWLVQPGGAMIASAVLNGMANLAWG